MTTSYTFDPDFGWRSERTNIPIPDLARRALYLLLEHNGKYVSRDELACAIWGGTPEYSGSYSASALDDVLSDVRKALRFTAVDIERKNDLGFRISVIEPTPDFSAAEPTPKPENITKPCVINVDVLRDENLQCAGGIERHMEILVATRRPLELNPDFAAATLKHLEKRALFTYMLPKSRLNITAIRLLSALALVGYQQDPKSHLNLEESDRQRITERWSVLKRSLCIIVTKSMPLTHLQIYNADLERECIVFIPLPDRKKCIRYAYGYGAHIIAEHLWTTPRFGHPVAPAPIEEGFYKRLERMTGDPAFTEQLRSAPARWPGF